MSPRQAMSATHSKIYKTELVETLATGSRFNALLFFGRLFEALTLLDIGNDAILFARLGETLECAFERFVGLNNNADHDIPLVKISFGAQIYLTLGFSSRGTQLGQKKATREGKTTSFGSVFHVFGPFFALFFFITCGLSKTYVYFSINKANFIHKIGVLTITWRS